MTSARLTIAAIPVALVWFLASKFAKWMSAFLACLRIFQIPAFVSLLLSQGILDHRWAISSILAVIAVTFLFTREAREWFDGKEIDPATFE
jgi:uncharacterized membrane protein